jgi:hypothetical protein
MSPKELLALNGDLRSSPLLEALRRFHALASEKNIRYCVIGGLAVIRNGAPRTTIDIDILTRRADWERCLPLGSGFVQEGPDACVDSPSGVGIDLVFIEDDWGTPFPDPRSAGEYDEELGANFLGLHALIQLKAFVYLAKLREDGKAVAAKDLGDVAALIRGNLGDLSIGSFEGYDPRVKSVCVDAYEEIKKSEANRKNRRA